MIVSNNLHGLGYVHGDPVYDSVGHFLGNYIVYPDGTNNLATLFNQPAQTSYAVFGPSTATVSPAPASKPTPAPTSTSASWGGSSVTSTAPAPAPTPAVTQPSAYNQRIAAIKASLSSIPLSRPDLIYSYIQQNQLTYDELMAAMGWDATKVNAILLQGSNMASGNSAQSAQSSQQTQSQLPQVQTSAPYKPSQSDSSQSSNPVSVTVKTDNKGLLIGLAIIGGILLIK